MHSKPVAGAPAFGLGLSLDTLQFGDLCKPLGDLPHLDAREIEPLAAREDGDRNIVRLGRAEDKLDMLGRLFKRFE